MARRPAVYEMPRSSRQTRRPSHPFYIVARPFQIVPFFIASVLPGETLNNLLVQSRVVSDPIRNPLIGWWQEYYFFYVKMRDLRLRDDYSELMINPQKSITGLMASADDAAHFTAKDGIEWVKECLQRVVEEYFRNEGEAWDDYTIGNYPVAQINGTDFSDSLISSTFSETSTFDQPLVDIAGSLAGDSAMDFERMMQQYHLNQMGQLTDMSFEDYLRTFGIRAPETELHRPELIRFIREWTYPTNTVDPSSGSPTSAVSWAIAERADKNRFFTEPGFLFGVSCTRPKIYKANQPFSANWGMRNGRSWLPAVLNDDPRLGWTGEIPGDGVSDNQGPLRMGADSDYSYDVRDLLVYGEQYTNVDMSAVDMNAVPLPLRDSNDAIELRYLYGSGGLAAVDALFTDTVGSAQTIRMDGVVNCNISGRQVNTTATIASQSPP